METNEMMMNEEVTEAVETATEGIVSGGSEGKWKAAAVGGLTVLIGGLAVQYIVIPTIAKIKAKKQKQNSDSDTIVDSKFTDDSNEEETEKDFDENIEETK